MKDRAHTNTYHANRPHARFVAAFALAAAALFAVPSDEPFVCYRRDAGRAIPRGLPVRGRDVVAGTWMMTFPDANVVPDAPTPPICVATGVMMCKPLVLSDGTWLLPNSNWVEEKSAGVTASFDKGVSWFFRGGATGPKHDRTCDISLQDSVTI